MADNTAANALLTSAFDWLKPVLLRESFEKAKAASFVDRLAPADVRGSDHARITVIRKALGFLSRLHSALSVEASPSSSLSLPPPGTDYLYDPKHRRTIYALFDLVSLEGIYPALSPGVGVPIERRVKSVLAQGVATRPVEESVLSREDRTLLEEVIHCLRDIQKSPGKGLEPILRDRTLVDLVAACAELAFGSAGTNGQDRNAAPWQGIYKDTLNKIETLTLFPILVSLLHSTTPPWIRPYLAGSLSLLPLRPNGVRATIEFVASASPQPVEDAKPSAQGPGIPLEALTQASKILVSVPKSLTPEAWFTGLAPQLLTLLDGADGPELRKTAGYIIGSILGRRQFGAPGAVGWKIFVQPLLDAVNPPDLIPNQRAKPDPESPLVQEQELDLALQRLQGVILSHPNPGLTQRLLTPIMLPLWGIACYAKQIGRGSWHGRITSLIQTYLKVSPGIARVVELVDHLLWDGATSWTYGPGDLGGIEIRRRDVSPKAERNIVELMSSIGIRVDEFINLLSNGVVDDAGIGTVFLTISRRWLLQPEKNNDANKQRLDMPRDDDAKDPLKMLMNAKIVQKILEQFKDKITGSSAQVFELIKQILEQFIEQQQIQAHRRNGLQRPSYAALGHIVHNSGEEQVGAGQEAEGPDNSEVVSISLSLLSSIITSPDFATSSENSKLLTDIQVLLKQVYALPIEVVPDSVSMTSKNLDSLITILVEDSTETPLDTRPRDPQIEEDRKAHRLALTYITDDLPPVRAQGLSILTSLITSRSAVLDIPATTVLLIGMLQDEEEYIYLTTVQTFAVLAGQHSRTVIKMLVDRYVDPSEELSLDHRLKIGEALLRTVEKLGGAFVEETARIVGEGMIGVAGRRAQRLKTWEDHKKRLLTKQKKNQEAEEAWGGEVPQLNEDEEPDEVNERLAKVLEGWQGKEGGEDVRIRTSALSILAKAVETNIAGLGSEIVSTAVDLSISILTMEKGDEAAILRRAAVLMIFAVVKAMDAAEEQGRKLGFGFAGENLADIIRVLQYVRDTDTDDLVRGHAGVVIDGLGAWQQKSLLGFAAQRPDPTPRFDLGGRIAGLSLNPEASVASRPRIEEIE